ncbi:hypothetical protein ABZ840_08160 [Streptomyces sp. NPDC047117]|uniref:hypothetical protein n=1 Tax=Streptomyces sp. NPDC047117 TaxID=3155379 RepID=UPI0033DC8085
MVGLEADSTVTRRGGISVQIEHDDIKGCTPEMLQWWFENLAGITTWNGEEFSGPEILNYHPWHHRDHIRMTPLTDAPDGTKNNGFRVGRSPGSTSSSTTTATASTR